MNKKKVFLVFFLATALAFALAYIINTKKASTKYIEHEQPPTKEEVVINTSSSEESLVEEKQEEILTNNIQENNQKTKEKTTDIEFIKPIKLEESVVKEDALVPEDVGVMKDNTTGEIIITREFKMKSPTKYSFINFGQLENVSSK